MSVPDESTRVPTVTRGSASNAQAGSKGLQRPPRFSFLRLRRRPSVQGRHKSKRRRRRAQPPLSTRRSARQRRALQKGPAPDVLPRSFGVAILHTEAPSTANVAMRSSGISLRQAPVTMTVEDEGFASACAAATSLSAVSSLFLPPSHSSSN